MPHEADSDERKVKRVKAETTNIETLSKFQVPTKTFTQQFAALYHLRTNLLRTRVMERAKKQWPGIKIAERTLDIEKGVECMIFGSLYKEMKLKPCILDDYNVDDDNKIEPTIKDGQYVSGDDSLVLEDEYGRVTLALPGDSSVNLAALSSGLVVCVKGYDSVDGSTFDVNEICFPPMPTQLPIQKPVNNNTSKRYALLVSGLSMGDPTSQPLSVQLLVDYVTGFLGGENDANKCASIERVIVCGNSLHRVPLVNENDFRKRQKTKSLLVKPLKDLDCLLTQLAASVKVDLMPGDSDPSNFTLPQQPLHSCLFPSARTYSSFTTHTNPLEVVVNGCKLLGTSGQNIDDLALYTKSDRIELMESTLRWGVIAPTAPDTLGCYPFQMDDPFVLKDEECPHVYFAGNQEEFGSRVIEGEDGQKVRLIAVPKFSKTHQAVLLDLSDLSVEVISFDVDL